MRTSKIRTSGNSVCPVATGGQDARRFAHGGAGEPCGRERRRVGRWRRLPGVKPGRRERPAAAVRRPRGPTNDRQRPARRSERTVRVHASKTFPCHLNSSRNFLTTGAESLIQFPLRSLTSQSTLTRARAGDKNRTTRAKLRQTRQDYSPRRANEANTRAK